MQASKAASKQTAGLSRAGAVFYVSVIPTSVARQVAWSRAVQTQIGILIKAFFIDLE